MILEALGIVVTGMVLTLIGFGLASWLVTPSEKGIAYTLGISPAVGLAIQIIVGFPLVRYVAPVHQWALPVTLILIGLSGTAAAIRWRRVQSLSPVGWDRTSVLAVAACVSVCFLALALPVMVNGIKYTAFRSNASDAFVYMSLAESVRVADWSTLTQATSLAQSNSVALARLASVSPTALFSARFIVPPTNLVTFPQSLNGVTALSWNAELVNIPVYRFYYLYHTVAFILSALLTLVLADVLELPRVLKYLAAGVVGFGFWARYLLESDASAQITTFPMLLLLILAWMQLEREPLKPISGARVLLALAATAIALVYVPLVGIAVAAFLLYYLSGLIGRRDSLRALLYHAVTVLLVLVIVLLTGQLDYHFRVLQFAFGNVEAQRAFRSGATELMLADGLSAIWGMPRSVIVNPLPLPGLVEFILRRVLDLVAIFLTIGLVISLYGTLSATSKPPRRILFATVVAGLVLWGYFLLGGNPHSAEKAFTSVFPCLTLGVLVLSQDVTARFGARTGRVVSAGFLIWLVGQIAIGAYLPWSQSLGIQAFGRKTTGTDLDLAPLTSYLDQHSPKLVLVAVPRKSTWIFAYYTIFALERYPLYLQSGIVIDNSLEKPNLWLQPLTESPDYAVILKDVDYIGTEGLGQKVAETHDLVLYHLDVHDPSVLAEKEKLFREQ